MTRTVATKLAQARELRDARGHFAELRCTNGHDRCYLGADEDCPYCERICRRCFERECFEAASRRIAFKRAEQLAGAE